MAQNGSKRLRPANGKNGAGYSSEEDMEQELAAATPPAQRTSARRQLRVDLNRLEVASLRKYRKVYNLGEMASGSTKEELLPSVVRHFGKLAVDEEDDTLVLFAATLRKRALPRANKKKA